jgi:hypothetical protein
MPVNEVPEIVPEKTSVSFLPTDGSAELQLLVNGEPEQVDEVRMLNGADLTKQTQSSEPTNRFSGEGR